MNNAERNAVKMVAKLSPWLAPVPSAWFVARSSVAHLAVPLLVGLVVAAIVETLGIATVHTALWLSDWNAHKRKSDPSAPTPVAVALMGVYLAATVGLTVVLEVAPGLATYAPAMFPALAVVGAVNLVLIAQQERRESALAEEREARKTAQRERTGRRARAHKNASSAVHTMRTGGAPGSAQSGAQNGVLGAINDGRRARREALLDALESALRDDPEMQPTELGRMLGVHRNTIYTYKSELEAAGRLPRNGGEGSDGAEGR